MKQTTLKISPAFKAIFEYRDALNTGRFRVIAKDLSCVVYFYANGLGDPCAVAYRGRAKKPAFNYRYKSEDSRANRVAEWMKSIQERCKTARTKEPCALSVGDVLMSMWGYEQTNVDYYLVTKRIGSTSVELVEIGQIKQETEWLQGKVIPNKEKIVGEPFRRVAKGPWVRIDKSIVARKEEPKIVAGCEVFNATHYTSYH